MHYDGFILFWNPIFLHFTERTTRLVLSVASAIFVVMRWVYEDIYPFLKLTLTLRKDWWNPTLTLMPIKFEDKQTNMGTTYWIWK